MIAGRWAAIVDPYATFVDTSETTVVPIRRKIAVSVKICGMQRRVSGDALPCQGRDPLLDQWLSLFGIPLLRWRKNETGLDMSLVISRDSNWRRLCGSLDATIPLS